MNEPEFLKVKSTDTVFVVEDEIAFLSHFRRFKRSRCLTLSQLANADLGEIKFVLG